MNEWMSEWVSGVEWQMPLDIFDQLTFAIFLDLMQFFFIYEISTKLYLLYTNIEI